MNPHRAPTGRLFDPGSTLSRHAWLDRDAEARFLAWLDGEPAPRLLGPLRGLTQRVSGSARRAEFGDGVAFVTEDDEALDRLVGGLAAAGRRRLAWFERPNWRNIALLLGCVLLLALGVRLGLPVVADRAAMAVPPALEARIGAMVFARMDGGAFTPSTLPSDRQAALQTLFAAVPRPPERARYQSAQSAVQHLGAAAGASLGTLLLDGADPTRLEGVPRIALFSMAITLLLPLGAAWVQGRLRAAPAPAAPLG